MQRNLIIVSIILLTISCSTRDDRMRLSSWVSSPSETKLLEQTLDDFRAKNPDIDFQFEPIPGNYSEKLQLMLGTRTAPDIFYLKGLTAPSYMSFDILQPLDDFIAQDATYDKEDFFPFLINAFQQDGIQYGIPKDFSPYVLYYNKKMFEEAGIDSIPTTWQELEETATKLTKDLDGDGKTDQYGFMVEPSIEMAMPFVYQNGGAFQKEDGALGVADDEFIEALDFYYGLYQKGIAATPMDLGTTWNGDAFGRERVAMVYSGGWLLPFLNDNFPDIDFGVAFLPAGKKQATVAFTTAYAMPKTLKEPENAWKLFSYLTGKEGMATWTSTGVALPSRKSVAIENGFYEHPIFKTFIESAEFALPLQVKYSERGYVESGTAMQKIFLGGKEPRQAMIDLAKRIEKYRLVE